MKNMAMLWALMGAAMIAMPNGVLGVTDSLATVGPERIRMRQSEMAITVHARTQNPARLDATVIQVRDLTHRRISLDVRNLPTVNPDDPVAPKTTNSTFVTGIRPDTRLFVIVHDAKNVAKGWARVHELNTNRLDPANQFKTINSITVFEDALEKITEPSEMFEKLANLVDHLKDRRRPEQKSMTMQVWRAQP